MQIRGGNNASVKQEVGSVYKHKISIVQVHAKQYIYKYVYIVYKANKSIKSMDHEK